MYWGTSTKYSEPKVLNQRFEHQYNLADMPRFYVQYMHLYLLIWSDISHHHNALSTLLVTNVTQFTLEPIIDNGIVSILSLFAATPDDFSLLTRLHAESDQVLLLSKLH